MHKITLICLSFVAAFPGLASAPGATRRAGLNIVTLNMAKETSAERVLKEWRASPTLSEADIFLLQEVKEDAGVPCIAARLGTALGMHVAYSAEEPGVLDRGLAILSRYPLREVQVRQLTAFDLRFHSRRRFALSAIADTKSGPVRLVDVHLDTRLNSAQRLAQLEPVMHDDAGKRIPRIIAGDFNSNPFYWVEHVIPLPFARSQARSVEDFMTGRGFRTALPESATTFDYLCMHLDWIWVTGLRPAASRVIPLDFSDHHAVWNRVEF